MSLFVTGFGPFLNVDENPSGQVAAQLGLPYEVLDVTFAAVDAFLDQFADMPHSALMMLGVAAGRSRMNLEVVARNRIGRVPDVLDSVMGPGPVHAATERHLHGGLWAGAEAWAGPMFDISVDAGDYLCNYFSFEAVRRFPNRQTGFLHLPLPTQNLTVDLMATGIRELLSSRARHLTGRAACFQ